MKPIASYFEKLSISTCPVTGLQRDLDIEIFTITKGEVQLHCLVYYLDADGDRITDLLRLRPYGRLLRATNQGRLGQKGNLQTQQEITTGEVTRIETVEELEARTIGEFDYYMSNMVVPTVLRDLLLQSVAISDNRQLFDI